LSCTQPNTLGIKNLIKNNTSTWRLFPPLRRRRNPRKLCRTPLFEVLGEKQPDLPDERFLSTQVSINTHIINNIKYHIRLNHNAAEILKLCAARNI